MNYVDQALPINLMIVAFRKRIRKVANSESEADTDYRTLQVDFSAGSSISNPDTHSYRYPFLVSDLVLLAEVILAHLPTDSILGD